MKLGSRQNHLVTLKITNFEVEPGQRQQYGILRVIWTGQWASAVYMPRSARAPSHE